MEKCFDYASIRRWVNHQGVEIFKRSKDMYDAANVVVEFNTPVLGFVTVQYDDVESGQRETLITNSITLCG